MIIDYENFGRETDLTYPSWWTTTGINWSVSADGAGPYSTGRYAQVSNGNNSALRRYSAFANQSTIFFQCHVMFQSVNNMIMEYDNGVQTEGYIYLNADYTLSWFFGAYQGLQVVKTTRTFSLNVWYHLQLKIVCSTTTTGTVELRMQGQTVAVATGVRTTYTQPYVNGWSLIATVARYANVLLYNATGNDPVDFTPETILYSSGPTGAGTATGWTPNGAAANYQCTDEAPADNDTTYVSAAAAGLSDTYTFGAAVPSGALVYAVAVELDARKDDAGSNILDAVIDSGGTVDTGGAFALSTTYQRFRQIWHTDPNTGAAWTQAAANAAEAGVKRTT